MLLSPHYLILLSLPAPCWQGHTVRGTKYDKQSNKHELVNVTVVFYTKRDILNANEISCTPNEQNPVCLMSCSHVVFVNILTVGTFQYMSSDVCLRRFLLTPQQLFIPLTLTEVDKVDHVTSPDTGHFEADVNNDRLIVSNVSLIMSLRKISEALKHSKHCPAAAAGRWEQEGFRKNGSPQYGRRWRN